MPDKKKYKTRHGELSVNEFVVLSQMRKTINKEGIEELADNIYVHGLIHPICVASTEQGNVVISGHRRLLACKILEKQGRSIGKLPTVIFENIGQIEIALLQASENIHEQVSPHEAAKFYEATWKLIKLYEPYFTLRSFARAVGRSEQTIRNALKFSLLSELIQKMVASNTISYGSALQLTRLQNLISESDIERWALRISYSNLNTKEVSRQIDTFIQDLNSGQMFLQDLFDENMKEEFEKQSKRLLIDNSTIHAFWAHMRYMNKLLALFDENKLSKEDYPWLRYGPKKAFLELVALLKILLKYMAVVLDKEEYDEARDVLIRCENLLALRKS